MLEPVIYGSIGQIWVIGPHLLPGVHHLRRDSLSFVARLVAFCAETRWGLGAVLVDGVGCGCDIVFAASAGGLHRGVLIHQGRSWSFIWAGEVGSPGGLPGDHRVLGCVTWRQYRGCCRCRPWPPVRRASARPHASELGAKHRRTREEREANSARNAGDFGGKGRRTRRKTQAISGGQGGDFAVAGAKGPPRSWGVPVRVRVL